MEHYSGGIEPHCISGYLRSTGDGRQAVLCNLFVPKEQRGKGLGRALVDEFTCWARSQNATEIRLDSTAAALGFWRSLGFLAQGRDEDGCTACVCKIAYQQ